MQRLSGIFQHRACGNQEVLAVMRVFGENKAEVKDSQHKGRGGGGMRDHRVLVGEVGRS